jgi:hypothetical protein
MNPKIVYEKFCNGDSLSDEEVNEGVIFYDYLSAKLFQCGPVFALAAREALRVRNTLHSYQQSRLEK